MTTLNDIKAELLGEGDDIKTLGTALHAAIGTINAILDATPGSADFEAALVIARANRVALAGEIADIAAEAARVTPVAPVVVEPTPEPVVDPITPEPEVPAVV